MSGTGFIWGTGGTVAISQKLCDCYPRVREKNSDIHVRHVYATSMRESQLNAGAHCFLLDLITVEYEFCNCNLLRNFSFIRYLRIMFRMVYEIKNNIDKLPLEKLL